MASKYSLYELGAITISKFKMAVGFSLDFTRPKFQTMLDGFV